MTTMWTTSQRPRGWPVHGFQSRMLAVFLGLTTTIAVWIYQPKYQWTAIERHYLMPYMLVSAGWFEKYAVLHTVDAKGKSHPATPAEVESVDVTMPYWNPGEELAHEAEARTIAESVFSDQPKETPFFIQTPRKIFAEMLRRGMDAGEMVRTMTDSAALAKLVEGTELASMISHSAPSQREGVRASLNLVADALRLKTKDEAQMTWSARAWSQHRRGWIFLTSTPELRAALQPLLSLWLDILVLRLMNTDDAPGRPVWFVLDEHGKLLHGRQPGPRSVARAAHGRVGPHG
jgi:hypothetical protein